MKTYNFINSSKNGVLGIHIFDFNYHIITNHYNIVNHKKIVSNN